jgi:outer membrane protein OmpA-like peptidoglycan-associated protein
MTHLWIKTLALGTLILAGTAIPAQASTNYRSVVRDTQGQVIRDSSGHCVRTKWISPDGACPGTLPQQVVQQTIKTHTHIVKEERTIYFAFNKADLSVAAKARLNTLAHTLKSADDVQEARSVGFADRIGSVPYNDRLSQKRAETVRNYLIAQGYANVSNTETRWFGESVPATKCPNAQPKTQLIACLQKDRRVEVEIGYRADTQVSDAR